MPEGDTIFRTARTLNRALAGRVVTRFESVYPQLTRVDVDTPLVGRTVDAVSAQGKHVLMHFSGDLVLRTHMRMSGSWHIYRAGERWQRPARDMRIVVETDGFVAVGFNIPVAEFETRHTLRRNEVLGSLGPDLLAPDFDQMEAIRRIRRRPTEEIASVLLNQRVVAGIGNIFKSESLFLAGISPFVTAVDVSDDQLTRLLAIARELLSANVLPSSKEGIVTYHGLQGKSLGADPADRLWVYGRAGKPCRRCGTVISARKQGLDARITYWCSRCQS